MDVTNLKQIISTNINTLKAFKEGEAALNQLENLEQVTKETQERVTVLKAEEATLQEKLDDANAQIAQARKDAAQVITDANETATKTLDDGIMQLERFQADQKSNLDQTNAALEVARNDLVTVQGQVEAANNELARVTGEIEKVKASIQSAFPPAA